MVCDAYGSAGIGDEVVANDGLWSITTLWEFETMWQDEHQRFAKIDPWSASAANAASLLRARSNSVT